jgi:hypothetical protein
LSLSGEDNSCGDRRKHDQDVYGVNHKDSPQRHREHREVAIHEKE